MGNIESFKTSVNVKFDIGKKEFVTRYLPTPSHASSLIGIANGFISENNNNAHIMIGPYGSGKSLVGTIVANLVSDSIKEEEISILIRKFEKVHQDVFKSLKKLTNVKKTYIPVTLSGNEGIFSEVVINSIVRSLASKNIKINLPSKTEAVLDSVNNWRKHYLLTFEEFQKILYKRKLDFKKWQEKLMKDSVKEIEWFKKVYPSLTSGSEFNPNSGGVFIEKIEYILRVLEENNIGIFIIYDEFGRMLQSLDHSQVYKTMQDLQDLAELTNRSNSHINLLLISHKSMSQYMLGFNAEYQSEFQRIEKRFATYFVESDSATYYRIVEQYTSKLDNKLINNDEITQEIMNLRKYNLFQELNQQEIEEIVVKGSYPIHPISLYLLPRISTVFGQNERTLFTFLESEETGGLRNHILKEKSYYYPYNLYEFFSLDKMSIGQDEALNSLKIFKSIEERVRSSLQSSELLKILKFITLWEITRSNSVYKLDTQLIAYSLNLNEEFVEESLEELVSLKCVRYNRILKQWELMEGSSLLLNEIINKELSALKISPRKRVNYLESKLQNQYYLASSYNDVKDMTRFMRVKLIDSTLVISKSITIEKLLKENADGYIYLIVLEKLDHYSKVLTKIERLKHPRLIFSVLKEDMLLIKNEIDRGLAILSLLENKQLLSEYNRLQEELKVNYEEIEYSIRKYLEMFFAFKSNVDWFHQAKKLTFQNESGLETYISDIMFNEYPKTPVIRNDSINRMNVIGIQRTSLHKVLNGVLNASEEDNLGIEGQGPDYLIYATVIKNNNINLSNLNDLENNNLSEIRNLLIEQIEQSPKAKLEKITSILSGAPFGIRKPLIPLLVVILLKDKWDQVMFYSNAMYIPALQGEKIYEMFNEPEKYSYEYHHYSEKLIDMMATLEYHFNDYVSEYVLDKTPLIRISSALLNWLRSLPRHTQITNRQQQELLDFKAIVRRSEINPLQSIEELEKVYGEDLSSLFLIIEELENYYEKFKVEIEKLLCETLSIHSLDQKEEFFQKWQTKDIVKNKLLSNLKEATDIESFSMNYIGTELFNWSDTTLDLFVSQIKQDLDSLSNESIVDENTYELTYNGKYRKIKKVDLSTKSTVVYNNLDRMIKNAGRTIPKEELHYIFYKLLNEYMD